MDTKYTPGPWTLYRYAATQDTHHHAVFASARDDGRRVTIATVYPVGDDGQNRGESYYNARLIAKVPVMLAALRQIVNDYDYEKGNCKPHTLAGHAKRAIQEAMGE